MPTCFVIQPFDNGKFDRRYKDIYKPAIEDAGFEAYRVDQDSAVSVPIDSIEAGIRNASICLADITLDNPNVWYELGYSFAAGKQVVIICSSERESKRYPFDIQHRSIISYSPESSSDFDALRDQITARIKGYSEKGQTLQQLAANEQIAPIDGLSPIEMTVLATLGSNAGTSSGKVGLWQAQQDAEKAGLRRLGFTLSLRRLVAKKLVDETEGRDYHGNTFEALLVTERGWDWIDANESRFILTTHKAQKYSSLQSSSDLTDDDIPFSSTNGWPPETG